MLLNVHTALGADGQIVGGVGMIRTDKNFAWCCPNTGYWTAGGGFKFSHTLAVEGEYGQWSHSFYSIALHGTFDYNDRQVSTKVLYYFPSQHAFQFFLSGNVGLLHARDFSTSERSHLSIVTASNSLLLGGGIGLETPVTSRFGIRAEWRYLHSGDSRELSFYYNSLPMSLGASVVIRFPRANNSLHRTSARGLSAARSGR
jgi:opacity protein-like surface antigen